MTDPDDHARGLAHGAHLVGWDSPVLVELWRARELDGAKRAARMADEIGRESSPE
jgi:hypothetical protein